jgi:uncharacterized protein (DUF2147 family)
MKFLLYSIVLLLVHSSSVQSDDIIGLWLDDSKKVIVECYKYETRYYARIRWFENDNPEVEKFSENGLPKSKWLNYKVMENFAFNGEYWDKGTIYQIKTGSKYDATIHMENKNHLVARGYVLITLFGKDAHFTRYTKALPVQK